MRIPTDKEYDRLVKVTGGDDAKIHWEGIYSWVDDTKDKGYPPGISRWIHGYYSARACTLELATHSEVSIGFRPAFELCEVDARAPEGELSIVGTLYMDGLPVEVPMVPMESGDIAGYTPGAKLEIRPPLLHPGYIVTGYRVGDVVIADRALLNQISYKDIEQALQGG